MQAPKPGKLQYFTNPNMHRLPDNIKYSARLGIPVIEDGCLSDAPGAIVCGTGPTLLGRQSLKRIRTLADKGYKVFAMKQAITLLTDRGVPVHYTVSIDPDARQIKKTPIAPGVTYILASSCDPRMINHCMQVGPHNVRLFHSACGVENEALLYVLMTGKHNIVSGGFTVVNRAVSVALDVMGVNKPIYVAGAPFGWRQGSGYYSAGVSMRPGNEAGRVFVDTRKEIDGRLWFTRLDLMASACDMAKRIKRGECIAIGDSMAHSLAQHDDEFIDRVVRSLSNDEVEELKQHIRDQHQPTEQDTEEKT